MTIQHLPASSPINAIHELLQRDGCLVLDAALDRDTLQAINREMEHHLGDCSKGKDEFSGRDTRRKGNLITHSPSSHGVILNPTVIGIAEQTVSHATTIQLHCTQIISVGPGSSPQPVHRDQWAFDKFPFPAGFEVTVATMWALTDFTEDNGATRVVPGPHKMDDRLTFSKSDTEAAEMSAGSVLLYLGSLHHGAGENLTDHDRSGLIVHYTLGWLRQEENQYLCVPPETLAELPEDLLRLMGYAHGGYSLGFIDAGRDPIAARRPDLERAKSPDQIPV